MTEKNTYFLQTMLDSELEESVAYKEYTEDRICYPDFLFCFFEGEDDPEYYSPRIVEIIGEKIFIYKTNGKNNLMNLKSYLKKKRIYNNDRKAFFIDCDFDNYVTTNELYVTPCHSIENFYARELVFKRFLITKLNMKETNPIFNEVMKNFKYVFKQYNSYVLTFNALLKYHNIYMKDKVKLYYDDTNIISFLEISIDNITMKSKMNKIINDYKEKLNIDMIKLTDIINELKGNEENKFRGKFQIQFFNEFPTSSTIVRGQGSF